MKFQKIGNIKINGANWKYGYGNTGCTKGNKNDGLCVYSTRSIVINPKSTRTLEDVICHESLHARFPDLSEEAVDNAANIIGEIINKFKTHNT
jgi:hypothetical protein